MSFNREDGSTPPIPRSDGNRSPDRTPLVDIPKNALDIQDLGVYYPRGVSLGTQVENKVGDIFRRNSTGNVAKIPPDNDRVYRLRDVTLPIVEHEITAIIGPSGVGKSTLLRALNDLLPEDAVTEGQIRLYGNDVSRMDSLLRRKLIGMVFQKPIPFQKTIHENVAWGARINGYSGNMNDWVQNCLTRAALWPEVKDRLKQSALSLSGGQQQRLCIARALAVEPEVLLMDEPCSALDPEATSRIEALMRSLVETDGRTIVVVTHNMQQASRVSHSTAFLLADAEKVGRLVEHRPTSQIFTTPQDKRTEDYITGRFG